MIKLNAKMRTIIIKALIEELSETRRQIEYDKANIQRTGLLLKKLKDDYENYKSLPAEAEKNLKDNRNKVAELEESLRKLKVSEEEIKEANPLIYN